MQAFELSHLLSDDGGVAQRPPWPDEAGLKSITQELRALPPLVTLDEVNQLRLLMAEAARGRAFVLQIGDCAEPIDDDGERRANAYLSLTRELGRIVHRELERPVVHLGRIAGQFAKPRSSLFEEVGGQILHAYRGDLVNDSRPISIARIPDCRRLLRGYRSASQTLSILRSSSQITYCSHEALILEYEAALMRKVNTHEAWLAGSAHLLWIGERTRNPDGAHAAVLSQTLNPLAIKVGPSADPAEIVALVERLNPKNEPGRITLITRLGVSEVSRKLPLLVGEVKRAGLDVGWICDPLHGNTITHPIAGKLRYVSEICLEVEQFMLTLNKFDIVATGLHLEASALARSECISECKSNMTMRGNTLRDRSLCDPRLDSAQARLVVKAAISTGFSSSRHSTEAKVLT